MFVENMVSDELGSDGMTGSLLIFICFYLFIIGAVFGSFATLVGDRVPAGQSIVRPGSACSHCGRRLGVFELIPMVSWLVLRGRCRTCETIIPMRYPIWELILGVSTVLAFWQSSSPMGWVLSFLLWFLLVIAVSTDVTALLVPNWLTYSAAIVLYVGSVVWLHSWRQPLVGMAVGFGIIFIVHLASGGRMGLGDAKLFLGVGAVLGWAHVIEAFFFACLYGAIIGLTFRPLGLLKRGQFVPFVPFIAAGVATAQFLIPNLPRWYLHVLLHLSA